MGEWGGMEKNPDVKTQHMQRCRNRKEPENSDYSWGLDYKVANGARWEWRGEQRPGREGTFWAGSEVGTVL